MSLAAAPPSPGRSGGADVVLTVLILAGLGAYAGMLASPYGLRVLALAGCQALMVLGYQFIFGHAGALSLAQGAFFGLGAYTTAILGTRYHWDASATFPLSILVPLSIAAIVAIPALRLASHYFALATLGLAQVALLVAVNAGDWTGGALGLTGVPGISVLGEAVPRGLPLTAAVWGVVGLGAWLAWRLTRGLTGSAHAVLRSDPIAASAIGLGQTRLRFAAFLLSAAYAGAAGALQAHTIGVVSSETLEFSVMVTCLAMTVIGGSTRIAGALIGALLLTYLPEWLRVLEGHAFLAYGAALLAMIILAPEGIAGVLGRALTRRRHASDLPTPAPVPWQAGRATLEARGLRKRFGGVVALDGVDLVVEPGEILGLIGPNGSGKTTLANVISGLVAPDDGIMRLGSRGLLGLSAEQVARAGIARGFQTPALPPSLTALELVALARASAAGRIGFLPSVLGRDAGRWRRRFEAEALDLLGRAGLSVEVDQPCGKLPAEFAWRVEVARALALDPGLVILDEPAAGLGERAQAQLGAVLREISSRGIGLLVIEHNMPFLLPTASRIVVLDQGRVIAKGRPGEVVRDPAVIAAYLGREKVPA
jgi:branched-chain amino acid transport system permease protein